MEDVRWGERPEKKGWLVELVGDQNPGAREGKSRGSKVDVRGKQLPEERCRRVGISESLGGGSQRRLPNRILPPHMGRKYLLSPRRGDGN